ncbi:MAG: lactate utilization protein [Clostridia bacterium]|nr:lactate utilization protein [Clostridia bacterium]
MMNQLESIAAKLRERGFEAAVFANREEAASFILGDVPAGAQVAIGGSMTVKEMDLHTMLREQGHEVLWHWEVPPAERHALLQQAMNAPVYLASANAITTDGLMVQIDGTGNRVAALCYGPNTVYVIIGRNKIVEGGYQQAVRRIKQIACPKNAQRLNLPTPCGQTGNCDMSACKAGSMCHMTVAFDGAPGGKRTQVVLINEDLGY